MSKMMRRTVAGALAFLAMVAPAFSATITVVDTGQVVSGADKDAVGIWQTTTVATFTTVQNVAQVTIAPGLWECQGTASMGTVTNASVITLGMSTATGAFATSSTGGGYPALIGNVAMTTQANATAGFPQLTTGKAFFSVSVATIVYLVESQTVTDTVTANLACTKLAGRN